MTNKWYQEGLAFKCTECGKCCTGSPGYVWVNMSEIEEMASFLNISIKDFKRLYVRRIGSRYSLIESKLTYDCVFLKDKTCRVYGARPTQCRTFPWWPQNLKSKESWEEVARGCEGINPKAPVVPFEEIETQQLIQITRHESAS